MTIRRHRLTQTLSFLHLTITTFPLSVFANESTSPKNKRGNNHNIVTLPLLHSDHVRSRHLRKLGQSTTHHPPSDQLYQGYGTHYLDLYVGTPDSPNDVQRQTLIVDTGSRVTAFPCTGCGSADRRSNASDVETEGVGCGKGYHLDPPYNVTGSKTFTKMGCAGCSIGYCRFGMGPFGAGSGLLDGGGKDDPQRGWCGMMMKYAEGSSWHAYEAMDFVQFGQHSNSSISENVSEKRHKPLRPNTRMLRNSKKIDRKADRHRYLHHHRHLENVESSAEGLEDALLERLFQIEMDNERIKGSHSSGSTPGNGVKSTEELQSTFMDEVHAAEKIVEEQHVEIKEKTQKEKHKKQQQKHREHQKQKQKQKEKEKQRQKQAEDMVPDVNNTLIPSSSATSSDPLSNNNTSTTTESLPNTKTTSFATKPFRLTFGCQTSVTGLFQTQYADGIMGMENSVSSFWNQMHSAGIITHRSFSLCFTEGQAVGDRAGTITLGGTDVRLHNGGGKMVYARNQKTKGWFKVEVTKMTVRMPPEKTGEWDGTYVTAEVDMDLSLFGDGFMVDSGTTESFLPYSAKIPLDKAFVELTGRMWQTKYEKSFFDGQNINDALPTIVLHFRAAEPLSSDEEGTNDVVFEIEPSKYLRYDYEDQVYVSSLHMMERGDVMPILGANLMVGYDVHFDAENGRVGFVKSDCDYHALV